MPDRDQAWVTCPRCAASRNPYSAPRPCDLGRVYQYRNDRPKDTVCVVPAWVAVEWALMGFIPYHLNVKASRFWVRLKQVEEDERARAGS